jgi:transposase
MAQGEDQERCDALTLAQLSARNELDLVHLPGSEMRQWRALIAYRHHLVQRRTKIKNHIRDLLLREGQLLPRIAALGRETDWRPWRRWSNLWAKYRLLSLLFTDFATARIAPPLAGRASLHIITTPEPLVICGTGVEPG